MKVGSFGALLAECDWTKLTASKRGLYVLKISEVLASSVVSKVSVRPHLWLLANKSF